MNYERAIETKKTDRNIGTNYNKLIQTYRNEDLLQIFGVSIPTIDRDLSALGRYGINIHSYASHGIMIHRVIDPGVINRMLMKYLVMNYTEYLHKHMETFFAFDNKEEALGNITKLQNAIDNCMVVNHTLKITGK